MASDVPVKIRGVLQAQHADLRRKALIARGQRDQAVLALLAACEPFIRRTCSCVPPCEDRDRRALREAVERVRAGMEVEG